MKKLKTLLAAVSVAVFAGAAWADAFTGGGIAGNPWVLDEGTEQDVITAGAVAKIGGNYYSTLAGAVADTAEEGDTIYILKDIDLTAAISSSHSFTLGSEPGNTYTVQCANSLGGTWWTLSGSAEQNLTNIVFDAGGESGYTCRFFLSIASDATLDLQDGAVIRNVKGVQGQTYSHGNFSIDGKMIMEEGSKLENLYSNKGSIRLQGNGMFIMNGGEISGVTTYAGGSNNEGVVAYVAGTGTFEMNGGYIHGTTPNGAIATVFLHGSHSGTATLNGGVIESTVTAGSVGIRGVGANTMIQVGGSFSAVSNLYNTKRQNIYAYNATRFQQVGTLTEPVGILHSSSTVGAQFGTTTNCAFTGEWNFTHDSKTTLQGCRLNDGLYWMQDGDTNGCAVAAGFVARIGDEYFTTLPGAFAVAENGDTIEVLTTVTHEGIDYVANDLIKKSGNSNDVVARIERVFYTQLKGAVDDAANEGDTIYMLKDVGKSGLADAVTAGGGCHPACNSIGALIPITNKSLTITSAPELGHTATIQRSTNDSLFWVMNDARVVVSNLFFDGSGSTNRGGASSSGDYGSCFNVTLGGRLTLESGTVISNFTAFAGAAVFVTTCWDKDWKTQGYEDGDTRLVMNEGAKIVDCKATSYAAAVCSSCGSLFEMNGGEISGCHVYVGGGDDAAVDVYGGGTFTMNGGAIQGNTTDGDASGVCVEASNSSTKPNVFNFLGGVVDGNGKYGAYIADGTYSLINIGGDAIATNSVGNVKNVYAVKNTSIHLADDFTGKVGIYQTTAAPGVQFGVTDGLHAGARNFFCDTDPTLFGEIKDGTKLVWAAHEEYIAGSWRAQDVESGSGDDAMFKVLPQVPDPVEFAAKGVTTNDYRALFKKVVLQDKGEGVYNVSVQLKDDVATTVSEYLQAKVQNEIYEAMQTTRTKGKLVKVYLTGGTPGLYYSVQATDDLGKTTDADWLKGEWHRDLCDSEGNFMVVVPYIDGNKAFYRLKAFVTRDDYPFAD